MLLVLNLVGLGLGPQLIGIVSDMVSGAFGTDSLRYALIGAAFLNIWACAHYYFAGRTLRHDLDNVDN